MDSQVVDAIKAAKKPFVPIVGADLGAFVKQLLDPAGYPGLKGVAVTNTAAVGGAGISAGAQAPQRRDGRPPLRLRPGPTRSCWTPWRSTT